MNPEAGARTGAAMLLIVSTCLLDSRARLQREYIEATKAMQRLAGRMERAGMLRSAA